MSAEHDVVGPYIVWEFHGYDGWSPNSYPTLKAALEGQRYCSTFVVTKTVQYDVAEKPDAT